MSTVEDDDDFIRVAAQHAEDGGGVRFARYWRC